MRERLFEVIESAKSNDWASRIYDIFMIIVIAVSLYPMALKEESIEVLRMEIAAAAIFCIDYILRWITADFKLKKGKKSFLLYPFTFMAILDIISIIPVIASVSNSFRIIRSVRLIRALRVVRAARFFRYSRNIEVIEHVIKRQKNALVAVMFMVVGYIVVSALLVYSVEWDTFPTFLDALYWSTVSLTTIGYGDYFPVTAIGKVITIVSSLVGIAVVAIPAGIITAGFIEEQNEHEAFSWKKETGQEEQNKN